MEKKAPKLKLPSDYPLFSFRTTKEEKAELMREIELVKNQMRKKQSEVEKLIKKNDVIVQALRLGLKALRQRSR